MKKRIYLIILSLAMLLPILAVAAIDAVVPPQYESSFLGGLKIKEDFAGSIDERKILLVGGSNIPFGVDCGIIEEYTGMPTVDFGLYAALGTKFMLEQSRGFIGEGDIVIICPETDSQTMSLYFGAEAVWQAADSCPEALLRVRFGDFGKLLGAYPAYLSNSLRIWQAGGIKAEGVYTVSSFDSHGDIKFPREKNTLPLGYDPNMMISITPSLADEEFIDYINEYTRYAEKKGAHVFYSFPPMNSSAVLSSAEEHRQFFRVLCETLECEIISSPESYILDQSLFYDSNFHLNDYGTAVRTMLLVEDILRTAGYTDRIELPAAYLEVSGGENEVSAVSYDDESTDEKYFVTEEFGGGVIITGVTSDGAGLTKISIPALIDGKNVLAVGEKAFSDCTELYEAVIPSSAAQLYDGIFDGCGKLERIVIESASASDIGVGEGLTRGAENAMIYVNNDAYVSFVSDYFWSRYASILRVREG